MFCGLVASIFSNGLLDLSVSMDFVSRRAYLGTVWPVDKRQDGSKDGIRPVVFEVSTVAERRLSNVSMMLGKRNKKKKFLKC